MAVYKNDTSWEFRAVYHDFTGKRKIKHKAGFKTKKAAKIAEAEFLELVTLQNGSGEMTFAQLYEFFIEDKKGKVKDSSIVSIDHKIQKHIMPYFKNKNVKDISLNDIRLWQKKLQDKNMQFQKKFWNP